MCTQVLRRCLAVRVGCPGLYLLFFLPLTCATARVSSLTPSQYALLTAFASPHFRSSLAPLSLPCAHTTHLLQFYIKRFLKKQESSHACAITYTIICALMVINTGESGASSKVFPNRSCVSLSSCCGETYTDCISRRSYF